MRRVVVVVFSLVVLMWISVAASAQVCRRIQLCDPGLKWGLSAEGGWLGYFRKGLVLNAEGGPFFTNSGVQVSQELPVEGPWFALELSASPNPRFSGYLKGTWLIPTNRSSSEEFDRISIWPPEGRQLSTSTQWYTLEGAGIYWGLYSGLGIIGGFRYDSYCTAFSNPTLFDFTGMGSLSDEADLTMNLYLPFVGLVLDQGSVQLGFIGFPTVIGELKYGTTYGGASFAGGWMRGDLGASFNGGYFVELFAQWGTELDIGPGALSSGNLSLFAKYSYLHGWATPDESFSSVGAPAASLGGPTANEVSFGLLRETYTIGARLDLAFSLPSWMY